MAKKGYGITPWGAWFIEVLNSYEMGARLDRGRSYANTGKVLSLDMTEGKARAKVKGNYQPFYQVGIDFPVLPEREKVYRLIEEDPALLARIAGGELPEEFLVRLKDEGIDLIPRRWGAMKRSCNCPDCGDPCKHQAALYYVIAREVDADPRVLFRLRGMDLEARFGRSVALSLPVPFAVTEAPAAPAAPATGELPEPPDLGEVPHCAELISSLLPPNPPFCDRDFGFTLAEFYHRAARFEFWEDEEASLERRFSRSRWSIICADPGPGAEPVLEETDILGNQVRHSLFDAYQQFAQFSSGQGGAEYGFLFYLFKFLTLVTRSCAFIPFVFLRQGVLRIVWKPYETLPQIAGTLSALAALEPGMLALDKAKGVRAKGAKAKAERGAAKNTGPRASGRSVVDLLSSAFLGEWVKRNYFSRQQSGGSQDYRDLVDLFFQGAEMKTASPVMRSLPAAIDRWLSVLHLDFAAWKYRLTIKNEASSDDSYNLSMDALFQEGDKIVKVPLSKIGKAQNPGRAEKSGKKAAGVLPASPLEILRAPTALSNYLPEIRSLMVQRTVGLAETRLAAFLDSAAPLLSRLGVQVDLPKALSRELKPRLVLKSSSKAGGTLVSYLNLDSILDWEWQVAVGDKVMNLGEFQKLLREKRALVRFKDGFVRINAEELAKLLKKAQETRPGAKDFLKTHFAGDTILSFDAQKILQGLFEERRFPPPQALEAELRSYQKRGYNWACSLLMSGFGCVLADDMGLGKTIQAIAVLLRLKEEGLLEEGCLVIAPAALLENWERELGRFAPSLKTARYHGAGRRLDKKAKDLFLTTYQTAVRDEKKLETEEFSLLIVDEAHLMKNAETRMSQTVKKLKPRFRLALSGTPVENRLEDLRSLFDFILPGYLGSPGEFKHEYRVPIEMLRNKEKAETLQKITAPFLLRRLKTDKTIIKDLPDKIVSNEYAALEKEQAALYEGVVSELIEKSEKLEEKLEIESKNRAVMVLSLLTSLKQICDHPRIYDKESPPVSRLSGKAQLLMTLLEEILAGGEKALIFSQYVEALDCLSQMITGELGEPVQIYHGGMSQKARSETIARFQNESGVRLLLVSLKAGGLGLNLTAASRVIHYDLWYNPAVENQATDRAFRIGQKRNVFVHRLITRNSFEEKIDAMISSKKELADMTVSSGESWLARMSHDDLKALFNR